jgi:hypothetical protein
MKKSKIPILLCGLLTFGPVYAANAPLTSLPTKEQLDKLVVAAWKERPHSIDVTLQVEVTWPPKSVEQIRQEIEDFFEKEIAALGENPHPVLLERTKASIEKNIQRRIKQQEFPRLIRKRIRISGDKQRVDQVIAEGGEQLDCEIPFEGTYVNVGDRNSEDFFSFHYEHKIKSATIEAKSGWVRRDPARFACLPLGGVLKAVLGVNQGTKTEPFFVPDPNKIEEFSHTGIMADRLRLTIAPDPNAPESRIRIEVRDPNYPGETILFCDKNDYSRVYCMKCYMPTTGKLLYMRECNTFFSQGFPRNVTEIQYDIDGSFRKKSVYRIESVELNPLIPDEVFEFDPPEGYKVVDLRSKKP